MLFVKVIFGFFVGVGIGVGLVENYAPKISSRPQVLSKAVEEVSSEETPTPSSSVSDVGLVASAGFDLSDEEGSLDVEGEDLPLTATLAITKTPTSTPSKTTKTPTSTVTLTPTPTPTLTPTSALESVAPLKSANPSEIHGYIDRFAAQYGIDANALRHIGVCESGLNPSASNGPYAGIYQFGESAWKNFRSQMGESGDLALRFDAEEAVQTAAYVISVAKKNIWPSCSP